MKLGLRLQILILLGGLLLVAFVPLYFTVATYTELTLAQLRNQHARMLGRAIAAHVAEARSGRSRVQLVSLVRAEVGTEGVEAIGVYDRSGTPLLRAGNAELVDRLAPKVEVTREALITLETEYGAAIAVVVPDTDGAVAAVVRVDNESSRATPLIRLVALYMGMIALGTLLLAFFALTRLIVRPLDALSRAARKVAAGARRLETPTAGAREISELARSVHTMTEKLLREEDALRNKIDEVERATERLREAQDRLIRSERLASVGRLAAGLAHEVGNPIAALIGMEDLLLEGGLNDEEKQDFLLRMRKETDRINRIIRDLLDFARPAGPTNADLAVSGVVATAIRDTVALLGPQKSFKEMELQVSIDDDLPDVPLSHERLMQVLLNLLLNAADACGGSGHIKLTAKKHQTGVRLAVEDDGPGVADDVKQTLFEPFVTTKEVGHGTGLGLSVCRGLVEAAGGTLHLDEERTLGARFVLDLPAASVLMS